MADDAEVESGLAVGTRAPRADRSASEVRADIERARAQIASSMSALRHEVAHRTDWREWVRTHPGACLGAAFAVGFWFGYRPGRR